MPFNGSGVFNRVYSWINDRNNGVKILAARVDAECDGFSTGLSNCVTKDGQTTVTANLPMAGFRHTGVGNASQRNDYAVAGQVQDGSYQWCGTAGGTANALTFTPSPAITAYAAGQRFQAVVATSNTGAATLAVSGLSAKDIFKSIGGALVALTVNDLIAGSIIDLEYDGTQFVLVNRHTYTRGADIASASTINLSAATGDYVYITGTTSITAITLAEGRQATTKFNGALTITNGASLICPGAANFTTAAGDVLVWRGEASGVVRCIGGLRANGRPLAGSLVVTRQHFTSSGTYTPSSGMVYCDIEVWGGGGGGGGAQSGFTGSTGGGGGAGGYARAIASAATIGGSQSVTIGAGGTGNSAAAGSSGGTTSVGSICAASGGSGGTTSGAAANPSQGGAGGAGTTGLVQKTGNAGTPGIGTTGSSVIPIGGQGGATSLGGANAQTVVNGDHAGEDAVANSGAGGNGGSSKSSAVAGGAGGSGYVMITEYCLQ